MKKSYASTFASKGGKARAKSLTKKERKTIARNAAKARWADREPETPTCPACSGEGACMGMLGKLVWFRCIACGMDFNKGDQ